MFDLKQFCSHYLIDPDFCTPAKENEKGRVENKIGYVRRNFFVPTIAVESIEELNEALLSFCIKEGNTSKHPDYPENNPYELYLKEQEYLITLPNREFE